MPDTRNLRTVVEVKNVCLDWSGGLQEGKRSFKDQPNYFFFSNETADRDQHFNLKNDFDFRKIFFGRWIGTESAKTSKFSGLPINPETAVLIPLSRFPKNIYHNHYVILGFIEVAHQFGLPVPANYPVYFAGFDFLGEKEDNVFFEKLMGPRRHFLGFPPSSPVCYARAIIGVPPFTDLPKAMKEDVPVGFNHAQHARAVATVQRAFNVMPGHTCSNFVLMIERSAEKRNITNWDDVVKITQEVLCRRMPSHSRHTNPRRFLILTSIPSFIYNINPCLTRQLLPRHRVESHKFHTIGFQPQMQLASDAIAMITNHGMAESWLNYLVPGAQDTLFLPPSLPPSLPHPPATVTTTSRAPRF